jgi:colicin import membrane protein
MIRKHENSVSWKAGALSFLVHAVLVAGLLISFNWKAAHSIPNVTEVDLWDKLPAPPVAKVDPVPPTPEVKEEPKPEPPKPVEKPKEEEPKVDIELEKKKQELAEKERQLELRKQKEKELEEKKLADKRKQEEAKEKLKQALREEDLKTANKNDAIKKLKNDVLSEEKGESDKLASAANASLRDQYIAKIQAKIRGNVNKTLCGDGDPELRFKIDLLPTGELSGSPSLTKSSGNAACDAAVERAIMASQPLPLPTEPSVRAEFRNMNLKFHPNGD